jgi:hypothetical protein
LKRSHSISVGCRNAPQGVVESWCLRMPQPTHTRKEGGILETASPTVITQIQPLPSPAIPPWMGEVAAFAHVLTHTGMLKTIQEQVRFARARFGKSRSHRFCRRPHRLHPFRRTDAAGLLRTIDSVGRAVHGLVWARPIAPSLYPVPVSDCSRPKHGGSPAHTLSRGGIGPQALSFLRWPGGSDGQAVHGHRRGRDSTSGAPMSSAADGRLACASSPV